MEIKDHIKILKNEERILTAQRQTTLDKLSILKQEFDIIDTQLYRCKEAIEYWRNK